MNDGKGIRLTWPTFEPLIASSLWLALAAGGAAFLAWYAVRPPAVASSGKAWRGTVALMAIGLLLVLAVLLNPTWVERAPRPGGKPVLSILVDATASMNTPDAPGGATRYRAASQLAGQVAERLGDKCDVRVKAFADVATATDAKALAGRDPSGTTTDLAAAIAAGLDVERPAGQALVLLSDGIQNTPGGTSRVLDAVRTTRATGAPVYTRTFGGEQSILDVAVEIRAPQTCRSSSKRCR